MIVENMKNVLFLIGGYGSFEKELLKKIKNLRNTKFIGRILPRDVIKLTKIADLIHTLFRTDNESMKNSFASKFLEAIVCEKPIMVFENTLMAYYVKKYNLGIVIKNIKELEEGIRKAMLLKKRGFKIPKRVKSMFGWQTMKKNLLKAYYFTLKRGG